MLVQGVTAFLPAGSPGRIYRANGAASQFPDDPGLWPPLRRAIISTPIPLPRFPVRRLKVGAGWWSKLDSPAGPSCLPAPRSFLISRRAPPCARLRPPASTFGPSNSERAVARPCSTGAGCYLQTVHTHETLPRTPPSCALVIFGKGQRAAASCLQPRRFPG